MQIWFDWKVKASLIISLKIPTNHMTVLLSRTLYSEAKQNVISKMIHAVKETDIRNLAYDGFQSYKAMYDFRIFIFRSRPLLFLGICGIVYIPILDWRLKIFNLDELRVTSTSFVISSFLYLFLFSKVLDCITII